MVRRGRLLVVALVVALPLLALLIARADDPKPLSEADLLKLIGVQASDQAVVARVEKARVNFKLDDALIECLKKAGASEVVLASLRKAGGKAGIAWEEGTAEPVTLDVGFSVSSLGYIQEGKSLLVAGENGCVSVWDVADRKERKAFATSDEGINWLTVSPDGKMWATGANDGTVALWDVSKREELFTLKGHTGYAEVSFSPDGKTLATGGEDKTVRLWDLEKRKELVALDVREVVFRVVYSPDGKTVAVGTVEGHVTLWDTKPPRKVLPMLKKHTIYCRGLAYSPDSKTLASAGAEGSVVLWDVESGEPTSTLEVDKQPILQLAFSPDGRLIALGCQDGMVRLWDPLAKKELAALRGHTAPVFALAFTPDGKTLATGGEDKTVRLWRVGKVMEGAR
jgi:WD40 repeat protein